MMSRPLNEIATDERPGRGHAVAEEETLERKRRVLSGEIAGSPHRDRRERSKRLNAEIKAGKNFIR